MMKRICALILCCLIFFYMFPQAAYALPTEQADAIQKLLDDAVRVSGSPGISVAVLSDNQTTYYNSGYTSSNKNNNPSVVDEHTLYEIGSTSKAFTAVGILLLQEQGLLSTTDRIEDHLPWFHVNYKNETAVVTIKNLLNHTSGLAKRHSDAPRGEGADMLRKTVEPFVGATLDFAPGTSYAYNNANYNILGLIIEAVSGQSYESFMKEQVFEPLGLHETYLYHSEAIETGRMAQGSRQAFFMTFPYDAPIYGGMKPAGFVISSSSDMARWAGIHLGLVGDIPEIFLRAIEKAHQADFNGPSTDIGFYYSAGWQIKPGGSVLIHDGQTPSFTSTVALLTEEARGIIFLANGYVEASLASGIRSILDGDLQQKYAMTQRQRIDFILVPFALFLFFIAITRLIIGIRNRIKYKPQLTKSKIITISFWVIAALLMLIGYPYGAGAGWVYMFDWNQPSITIMSFIVPIFFIVSAWYAYTKNPKLPSKKSIGEDTKQAK